MYVMKTINLQNNIWIFKEFASDILFIILICTCAYIHIFQIKSWKLSVNDTYSVCGTYACISYIHKLVQIEHAYSRTRTLLKLVNT